MREKSIAVCKALAWCACMLMFPILSGVLSAVLSLETVGTLFLQGAFMLLSLLVPLGFAWAGRWGREEIGFGPIDADGCRRMLYFLPMLAVLIPAAGKGFCAKPAPYVLGSLFLYLAVGIAEEVYFRGVIPRCLSKVFSRKSVIFLSAVIFGAGHIASAFTADSGSEILLTVLNALIFGWLTMEMAVICKNITPGILLHALFDFETKLVAMEGNELLTAECVRGGIMAVEAVWLWIVVTKPAGERIKRGR